MKMREAIVGFMASVAIVIASATPAYAQGVPELPHAFYGSVLVNGAPALDGTQVSATVSAGTVITNAQNPVATAGGSYGINSPPLLVQGDIPNGATVTFHVANQNGTAAASVTAAFEAGGGPTRCDLSVTIASLAPTAAGGGGGGGEAAPPPGMTSLADKVNISGTFTSTVVAFSADEMASVTIDTSTTGRTASGTPLTQITIMPTTSAHVLPEGKSAAAPTYDFGPSGATFDKPIAISIKYDSSKLPAGVNESTIYVAFWDANAGQWQKLDSTVDKTNKVATGQTTHFTEFTALAPTKPATFTVSNLSIAPAEAEIGKMVNIIITLTNSGDLDGVCTVTLTINGVVISTLNVTVEGNGSQTVTFNTSKEAAGTYQVDVNGLTGSFNVKPMPTPKPTPTPAPTLTPVGPAPVPEGSIPIIDAHGKVQSWHLLGTLLASLYRCQGSI